MGDVVPAPQGLITHDNVWQFGVLGIVTVGLVVLLVVLWRHMVKRETQQGEERAAMVEERHGWDTERERAKHEKEKFEINLRAEYEARHRELSTNYAKELSEQVKGFRENASAQARDFTDTIKDVAERQERAADKHVAMAEKLTEKLTVIATERGGSRGGGGIGGYGPHRPGG